MTDLASSCRLIPSEGWDGERPGPVGPAAIVIFGATGDLTRRKLMPALYNLLVCGLLSEEVCVIGTSRGESTNQAFRDQVAANLASFSESEPDPHTSAQLLERTSYVAGTFEDEETYRRIQAELERTARENNTGGNVLFYLATAPRYFSSIVKKLGQHGLTKEDTGWRRVIVEKPFGTDLESARALNRELLEVLAEDQIYRIDHYLAKETVQNILVFRFGNGIFEPIWNRRYIDHVQITVSENLGVEGRGGYYDRAGALRDMIPNHLMQLVALVAMEPPSSFQAEAVREERSKALSAIQEMTPEMVLTHAVRGQYGSGNLSDEVVSGYREEDSVDSGSKTETFAALKLHIDNWRWAGVPFYLRTGKRMKRRVSEISIQFRRPPLHLFKDTPVDQLDRNVLTIRVAPDEGIALEIGTKVPGPQVQMAGVAMEFRYSDHFGKTSSTGYETLLWDAIRGDTTLFQRADMVEAGWSVVDPVLEVWDALGVRDFPNYEAGSWGPAAADELLAADGHEWQIPES